MAVAKPTVQLNALARVRRSPEWQLLGGAIWRASRSLALAWWLLVLVRSLLPGALAVSMGLLVSALQAGGSVAGPLAMTGAVFVALQILGPLHTEVGWTLGSRTGSWLYDQLAKTTVEPAGIAHLEDSELVDDLRLGREFDLGMTGPDLAGCMAQVGQGLVAFGGGIASVLVLFGYHWWVAVVVGVAWFSPQWLLRESIRWKDWRSDEVKENQRAAEYAYKIAVEPPGAKEIRLFGLAGWVVEWFVSRRRALADLSLEAVQLRERSLSLALLVMLVANGSLFVLLAWDAAAGRIGLGQLTTFATAAMGASALASVDFGWWLHTGARPVPVVLGLKERMAANDLPSNGSQPATELPRSAIRFHDVRFAYPSRPDKPVLDGLDFTIEAGKSVAIVGQNGAGKSTLIKLLCRLYDPQSGAVEVDGSELPDLDLRQWRSRISAVFQDFVRYDLPLRDNVAPSGGADDDSIRTALEQAGASGIADLDTVLSKSYEGGTDLSGGQWQRVALARALCSVERGAKVVILDEPTAQLDVRGEAEIFDRVLQATRGCTTILISHRFSTVRHADRICVLESGRVVEDGTHEELMALGGRYERMFSIQAARFVDEPEGDE